MADEAYSCMSERIAARQQLGNLPHPDEPPLKGSLKPVVVGGIQSNNMYPVLPEQEAGDHDDDDDSEDEPEPWVPPSRLPWVAVFIVAALVIIAAAVSLRR